MSVTGDARPPCAACSGSGVTVFAKKPGRCQVCGGTGIVPDRPEPQVPRKLRRFYENQTASR